MITLIELRDVVDNDLDVFFKQYQNPKAQYMAGFISKEPSNRTAYDEHWTKIRNDDDVHIQTILYDGEICGHIAKFVMFGEDEITYWLGEKYWGKGIATEAVKLFLQQVPERPLYARTAKDNMGSIRVLEKCGFRYDGDDKGFANARDEEIEESIYKLN